MEVGGIFSFIMLVILAAIVIVVIFVIEDETEPKEKFWVAVGQNGGETNYGNIMWSEQGINWNDSLTNGDSFTEYATSVSYGENLWVAGGRTTTSSIGNIMTSSNGKKWTAVSEGASMQFSVDGVAYGKGGSNENLWVAVGDNTDGGGTSYGNVMWSTTGTCWVATSEGASFSTEGNGVAYGKGGSNENLWVAVGDNTGGTSYGNIMWSTTGTCWVATSEGASFLDSGFGVAYGKGENNENLWVAVGNNTDSGGDAYGNIMWSTTGTCWVATTEGASFSSAGLGVTYNDGLWVAVGDNTTDGGVSRGNILTSTNGKIWSNNTKGDTFSEYGFGVAAKT